MASPPRLTPEPGQLSEDGALDLGPSFGWHLPPLDVPHVEGVDDLLPKRLDLRMAYVEVELGETLRDPVQNADGIGGTHFDDGRQRRRLVVDDDAGLRGCRRRVPPAGGVGLGPARQADLE